MSSTTGKRPDYMVAFDDFWRELVTDDTGALDVDKVARELADYASVMEEASKAYEELSGLSKPNSAAVHVIRLAEERFSERFADYLIDAIHALGDGPYSPEDLLAVAEDWSEGSVERHAEYRQRVADVAAERAAGAS